MLAQRTAILLDSFENIQGEWVLKISIAKVSAEIRDCVMRYISF